MEFVKKLEVTLTDWYKQVPFHLPEGGRKWLSENVWWIVLIGAIASVLSIIGGINTYFWGQQVVSQIDGTVYYAGAPDMTWVGLGVVFYVAVAILEVMAISPLKMRQKKGWNLLFIAMLVSALSAVVTAVLTMSLGSLVGAAIGFAVCGYFLFEIHERFSNVSRVTKNTVSHKNS